MGSVDNFEEFYKNHVKKYSLTAINTSDNLLSVIEARNANAASATAPKQTNAVGPSATLTASAPATQTPTASTSSRKPRSLNQLQLDALKFLKEMNYPFGSSFASTRASQSQQVNQSVVAKTLTPTQSMKRPVDQVSTSQEQYKKTKVDVGGSSATVAASRVKSASNSRKTVIVRPTKIATNTASRTATVPASQTATVPTSRTAKSSASQTAAASASQTATVPTSRTAKSSASQTAAASASRTATVPASRTATVSASRTSTVSASRTATVPATQTATASASGTAKASASGTAKASASGTAKASASGTATGPASRTRTVAPTLSVKGPNSQPATVTRSNPIVGFQLVQVPATQLIPNLTIPNAHMQPRQPPHILHLPPMTAGPSLRPYLYNVPLKAAAGSQKTQQTEPIPSTSKNSQLFQHVTPKAYEVLKLINPNHFNDGFLQAGLFEADIVEPRHTEYYNVLKYVLHSQAHSSFEMDLLSVLKITQRSASSSAAIQNPDVTSATDPFKMMLWHGTRPNNIAHILKDGFKCPQTGSQMFGKGVYFADRISKSAQYCNQNVYCAIPEPREIGYMFLCEVALGKCYNAKNMKKEYKTAPTATRYDGSVMTFDSVKCTGENIPDREQQDKICGVIWPFGRTVKNTRFPTYTVLFNEYTVYNPELIKIKYLVKVQFK